MHYTQKIPTQIEMYNKAHRQVNDALQFAYWMAGKMPDKNGEYINNPLTRAEIEVMANSGKIYATTYRRILDGMA